MTAADFPTLGITALFSRALCKLPPKQKETHHDLDARDGIANMRRHAGYVCAGRLSPQRIESLTAERVQSHVSLIYTKSSLTLRFSGLALSPYQATSLTAITSSEGEIEPWTPARLTVVILSSPIHY